MTRVSRIFVVLALLLTCLPACRKHAVDPNAPVQEEERNPLKPRADDPMAKNDIQRGTQKRLVENMMHQMGLAYTMYVGENNNRGPTTVDVFKNYIKKDYRNEHLALESGTIVFIPNVNPGSGSKLIAYEKDKYEKWNNRVVLFSDGHVETLEEEAFRAALKGKQ